jgi:hypothetical protein
MSPKRVHPSHRERDLCDRVERLEKTLGTAIMWIAQSASSPLSIRDAEALLKMLTPEQERP